MNTLNTFNSLSLKSLSLEENQIWDFPKILETDDSIVKYDYSTIYDEHHGSGTVENADRLHFHTKNVDQWLLPSESYLLVQCRLRKVDGTEYVWENIPANDAGVAAVAADNISLDENAFNLFEKAKYFIDDQAVESIDYLGVATLVNNMFTYTDFSKDLNVKHSQLWFKDLDVRMNYVRKCKGIVNLLLPLNKIFTFCDFNKHVFRGVKHRIELTLNDSSKLIHKGPGVADGQVKIISAKWIMPYVEPSLTMMAKLESQLATQSNIKLNWPAISVFRYEPAKTQKVRLDLSATIHKPTKIIIMTQNLQRAESQEHSSMGLDHLSLKESYVEVNGIKFPDNPIKTDFDNVDYQEAYNNFIKMCKNGVSSINMELFKKTYPMMCIDVSKHKPELYESTTFPNIVVNLEFNAAPADDYVLWVVIYNEREARMSLDQRKTRVIM